MATVELAIKAVQTGISTKELQQLKILARKSISIILENLQNTKKLRFTLYANTLFLVDLMIVNNQKMAKLNYRYRQQNVSTNVLSLQNYSKNEIGQGIKLPEVSLGSIIICSDIAKSEAEQANIQFNEHFLRLLIHGFLHLWGYDHNTEVLAMEMYDLENYLLTKLNLKTYGIIANYWK